MPPSFNSTTLSKSIFFSGLPADIKASCVSVASYPISEPCHPPIPSHKTPLTQNTPQKTPLRKLPPEKYGETLFEKNLRKTLVYKTPPPERHIHYFLYRLPRFVQRKPPLACVCTFSPLRESQRTRVSGHTGESTPATPRFSPFLEMVGNKALSTPTSHAP